MDMKKIFFLSSILIIAGVGCLNKNETSYLQTTLPVPTSTQQVKPQLDAPAEYEKGGDLYVNYPDEVNTKFQLSKDYSYYGTAQIKGFVDMAMVPTHPFDETSTATTQYAFFKILETETPDLLKFIENNKGNSFVRTQAVGLGCVENGKLSSVNSGDKGGFSNLIEGTNFVKLLKSSSSSPIILQLTKPIFLGGSGAPACYSHFRNFKIITN
jgi:hypothetical protein